MDIISNLPAKAIALRFSLTPLPFVRALPAPCTCSHYSSPPSMEHTNEKQYAPSLHEKDLQVVHHGDNGPCLRRFQPERGC